MQGDFSRDTFAPEHRFSRVLMQQGRVLLDADWNEQTSILLDYLRTLAADLIGPHWGTGDGFRIAGDPDRPGDFVITPGHYWVDGILCVCTPVGEGDEAEPVRYTAQPDLPLEEDEELEEGAAYFVYLDVWERHLSHLEVEDIREVALGGPDTATRARVVWQVRVAELSTRPPDERSCSDMLADLLDRPGAGMRARARVEEPSDDPCIIPPEARYRGAENQLYRVEIHDGGEPDATGDGATFKWSRENASVIFGIRSLQGSTVALESLGPDQARGLEPGDWVEVVDDRSVLRGEPRPLRRVSEVDRVGFEVVLAVPEGQSMPVFDEDSTLHPLLRRWDQGSDAVVLQEGRWIDLEDGVQVWFEPGGRYAPGDHWLIPARTATGDVLWPADVEAGGERTPRTLPPHGIRHHYAPLARIRFGGDGALDDPFDCRCTFERPCAAEGRGGGFEPVPPDDRPEPEPVPEPDRPGPVGPAERDRLIAELDEIDEVGPSRAEVLFRAGRRTPAAVAELEVEELQELLEVGASTAERIRASARERSG